MELSGGNLQQCGFARAVAPDQANPLASANADFGAVEELLGAEGEMDVLEKKQGWSHGRCLACTEAARKR